MITKIDHIETANNRLLSIYKEALNIKALLNVLFTQSNDIEEIFQKILTGIDIDNAYDDQLDTLGTLLGLEKFLTVCWDKDGISGEANYDIDDDIVRKGKTFFPELNVSRKINIFQEQLITFLQNARRSNNKLYKFTLEYGCLPKHTNEILGDLQKKKRLEANPSKKEKLLSQLEILQ